MKTSAAPLAYCLAGAWAFAPAAALGAPGYDSASNIGVIAKVVDDTPGRFTALAEGGWQETILRTIQQGVALIAAGYQRAPVLVMILSALLVLPAVALLSLFARRAASAARSTPQPVKAQADADSNIRAWPTHAWLSIDGEAASAHPIAGEMIRIGRHPDNEVWLTDTSVHRYHAVIHRTDDADFFITDLSGEEGNGMRINGARRMQSPLTDGDVIELGKARMTFASTPI